jgi:preprotein translocase subunit SecB
MATGGLEAQFQFASYKIDLIRMKMNNELQNLVNNNSLGQESMSLSMNIRNTEKFLINGKIYYVGGLTTKIHVQGSSNTDSMLDGEFGISGIFFPVGQISQKAEDTFTKINMPALLMPYLRVAITNILSCAGFGTVLLPLVNIYELAQRQNPRLIDRTGENNNS